MRDDDCREIGHKSGKNTSMMSIEYLGRIYEINDDNCESGKSKVSFGYESDIDSLLCDLESNEISEIQMSKSDVFKTIFAEIEMDLNKKTAKFILKFDDLSRDTKIVCKINGKIVDKNDKHDYGVEVYYGDILDFFITSKKSLELNGQIGNLKSIAKGILKIVVSKSRSQINSNNSDDSKEIKVLFSEMPEKSFNEQDRRNNRTKSTPFHESTILSSTLYKKFDDIIRLQCEIDSRLRHIDTIVEEIESHKKMSPQTNFQGPYSTINGNNIQKVLTNSFNVNVDRNSESSESIMNPNVANCSEPIGEIYPGTTDSSLDGLSKPVPEESCVKRATEPNMISYQGKSAPSTSRRFFFNRIFRICTRSSWDFDE